MKDEPISFAPSQSFDGNDGAWSTFTVRVGKPSQEFRVIPSTTAYETWVPTPEGCAQQPVVDCAERRGAFVGLFLFNESSTWKELGVYELLLDKQLGFTGNGIFGMDTIGLQIQNSGGIELDKQVVAGIYSNDFYLGVFGLGPKPNNFSDFDYPVPSFMRTLKDQGKIPSVSYGYTAGSWYKSPSVFGSLTLGGYDESRFTSSGVEFPFDGDDSFPVSINIEAITATNTLNGLVTLLGDTQEVYAPIDSTTSQLWLPKDVCDGFESGFGLEYDEKTGLYLVNDTVREQLLISKPTVTIGVGLNMNPVERVNIVFPYEAFDLEASQPIYETPTRYFPIRRADNSSQYRLGRTFLQEAYVIADYERSKFSVHQARAGSADPSSPARLTPIYPVGVNVSTENSTHAQTGHRSLSKVAIAGIVVGCWGAIGLCIILILIHRVWKGKRVSNPTLPEAQYVHDGIHELRCPGPSEAFGIPIHELHQEAGELKGRALVACLTDEKETKSWPEFKANDLEKQQNRTEAMSLK